MSDTTTTGRRKARGLWRMGRWAVIFGLLALPAVAMRFTSEVNWTAFDFMVMGVLLIGAGLAYEAVAAQLKTDLSRTILGLGVMGLAVVIWAQLAVGAVSQAIAYLFGLGAG